MSMFRTAADLGLSGRLSSDITAPGVHNGQLSSSIFISPSRHLMRADLGNVDSDRLGLVVDTYEPGGGSARHTHSNIEQAYYIIQGTARISVGDEERNVSSGAVVYVPQNIEHDFANVGTDVLVLLIANSYTS